jgi:hypothetical protein
MVETTPLTSAASNDLGYGYDSSGNILVKTEDSDTAVASIQITGGASTGDGVAGGTITLAPGSAGTGDSDGGDLILFGGSGSGSGRQGQILMIAIPSVDPHVFGALWNNLGILTISAG